MNPERKIIEKQAKMIEDLIYICRVQAEQIMLLQNPQITLGGDIKAPEGWRGRIRAGSTVGNL